MPEENSIFMKTSSRALGILTQLHSETAQAMYAYTVGRQQGANEMALSNAILAERLIGCYRVIPSLHDSGIRPSYNGCQRNHFGRWHRPGYLLCEGNRPRGFFYKREVCVFRHQSTKSNHHWGCSSLCYLYK